MSLQDCADCYSNVERLLGKLSTSGLLLQRRNDEQTQYPLRKDVAVLARKNYLVGADAAHGLGCLTID